MREVQSCVVDLGILHRCWWSKETGPEEVLSGKAAGGTDSPSHMAAAAWLSSIYLGREFVIFVTGN